MITYREMDAETRTRYTGTLRTLIVQNERLAQCRDLPGISKRRMAFVREGYARQAAEYRAQLDSAIRVDSEEFGAQPVTLG